MEPPTAQHFALIFSNAQHDAAAELSTSVVVAGGVVHKGHLSKATPPAAALGQSASEGAETSMDTGIAPPLMLDHQTVIAVCAVP
jgi:hypothetical protein